MYKQGFAYGICYTAIACNKGNNMVACIGKGVVGVFSVGAIFCITFCKVPFVGGGTNCIVPFKSKGITLAILGIIKIYGGLVKKGANKIGQAE